MRVSKNWQLYNRVNPEINGQPCNAGHIEKVERRLKNDEKQNNL